MELIKDKEYGGERPLYMSRDLRLENITVHLGESSLKECKNIEAANCRFEGKYVFWETYGLKAEQCYFAESARSSVWYSDDLSLKDCQVDAPKMFRRATNIQIDGCTFPNGEETLWDCNHVTIRNSRILRADYLGMHTDNVELDHYYQEGNYAFQYSRNVTIRNSVLNSKDALWEAENVTVIDSEINGEYLAWYAKNLRLVRCHITGTQPLCYVDGLILEDCTFGSDADLALEYSNVSGNILGHVVSIKNPTTGSLRVESLGEYIIDENQKKPADFQLLR